MKMTSKMKMTSNMKTNKDELKNEDVPKNCPQPKNNFAPPPPSPFTILPDFFLRPLTLTATTQMMLNRKCYQVSKPEIEFHMMDIMYAALHMRAHTKKTTFSCKDDKGESLHVY